MGNRDKARADRSEGKYNPPDDWNFWNTDKTIADRTEAKNEYREAWNDKDREIKNKD